MTPQYRTLVLFGAGASYGSDDPQHVPPMGDSLFDALRDFSPNLWGSIPPAQAALFRGDFERGMEALGNSHPEKLTLLQWAMATYFFQFSPRNIGLYFQLACRLKAANWRGAIATLNYERLLPSALSRANVPMTRGASGASGLELCLPHGICNLFIQGNWVNPHFVGRDGFGVTLGDAAPLLQIDDPSLFWLQTHFDGIPPVMSYFESMKRTMAGNHFINQQRERFAQLAADTELIVIIGVRVRERDQHIWRPIASSPARVLYCSGSAGAEFLAWANSARPGKGSVNLDGRFKDRFEAICNALGI